MQFLRTNAVLAAFILSILSLFIGSANAVETAYFCDGSGEKVNKKYFKKNPPFRICLPSGSTIEYEKCGDDNCPDKTKYILKTLYSDQLPSNLWPKEDIVYTGKKCTGEYESCVRITSDGKINMSPGYTWDGPSGPAFDTAKLMRSSMVHDSFYDLLRSKDICYDDDKARTAADAYGFMLECEDGAVNPTVVTWAGHNFGSSKIDDAIKTRSCSPTVPGRTENPNKDLRCKVNKEGSKKVKVAEVKVNGGWKNWREVNN